ncbi:uncharacterized protein N7459_001150 [Penicillium hispanicum]|uniref:uncharacterized protein n=1 Tax=Penicillium hispanicum TaxID=1080232 RepID=UPI002541273E|nr:uncharacterized protein N7459_001150 [Penicillium hispanicum]KAJ5594942.1 hypothetical protein N7459_001150 [Penicillium hispanicum]
MFDLPSAKRLVPYYMPPIVYPLTVSFSIRRHEVLSPSSSREPSPVDESDLQDAHARLGKLLDLEGLIAADTTPDTKNSLPPAEYGENEDEEQEFEFRLFSAPAKPNDTAAPDQTVQKKTSDGENEGTGGTQKLRIRLRSPTPASGDPSEGRFVKAFRGWQYYFSTPSLLGLKEGQAEDERQLERRRQFEDTAVTGQHMMTCAKSQPWPGCHLPWRVIHLKRHQTKLPPKSKDVPVYVVEGALPAKSPKTRKKPGKKRRVQLRKKVAAAEAAKETEAEKRNRKNRERKIKRRQKAREEKAAAAAAGGGNVDVSMADADGLSSEGED